MEISDFLESPVNSIFTHIASLEVLNPIHESSKKKKKKPEAESGGCKLWKSISNQHYKHYDQQNQRVLKHGQNDNAETKRQKKKNLSFFFAESKWKGIWFMFRLPKALWGAENCPLYHKAVGFLQHFHFNLLTIDDS